MFDDTESGEPWLPCRAPRWCAAFGDRLSASLINRRLPYVFKEGALGMVLNAHSRIRCSFFADGGTMTRQCTNDSPPGCEPGCCNNDGIPWWCEDVSIESQTIYGCAFRPRDMGMMLQHHELRPGSFNEVIVDPTAWSSDAVDPPEAIEAFYFIRDPPHQGRRLWRKPRDGEAKARDIHAKFHAKYPNAAVPLVRLELQRSVGPFTRVA